MLFIRLQSWRPTRRERTISSCSACGKFARPRAAQCAPIRSRFCSLANFPSQRSECNAQANATPRQRSLQTRLLCSNRYQKTFASSRAPGAGSQVLVRAPHSLSHGGAPLTKLRFSLGQQGTLLAQRERCRNTTSARRCEASTPSLQLSFICAELVCFYARVSLSILWLLFCSLPDSKCGKRQSWMGLVICRHQQVIIDTIGQTLFPASPCVQAYADCWILGGTCGGLQFNACYSDNSLLVRRDSPCSPTNFPLKARGKCRRTDCARLTTRVYSITSFAPSCSPQL